MIVKELIFIDKELRDKDQLFNFCMTKLDNYELINDKQLFLTDIKQREEILPTSVGFGIAIPHSRCIAVKQSFILFVRLKKAIKWNLRDDQKTDLVFMIGVPQNKNSGNIHLRILSTISKKLMHGEFREKLRKLNQNEIYCLLSEIDREITERF